MTSRKKVQSCEATKFTSFTKPCLRWIGGKSQILDRVMERIPVKIGNYHEPFVGGGSILIRVLETRTITGRVVASDYNADLINLYKQIQCDPKSLLKLLKSYSREYFDLDDDQRKEYYYDKRVQYNKETNVVVKSALFIFLNKTCFRGMYRTGPGGFNVPFGHYKSPDIYSQNVVDNITKLSSLFSRVEFIHCSFEKNPCWTDNPVVDGVRSFMYLDPPYMLETKTSFVGYTRDGFPLEKHQLLFKLTKETKSRFLMSNAAVSLVLNEFSDYNVTVFSCKRLINSKNPGHTTNEVLISKD